jgi:sec-independent protein translocase protein TatA
MFDQQTSILIFLAIVVLFGGSKLPELAKSLGKATGEFKKAQIEAETELSNLRLKNKLEGEHKNQIIPNKIETDLNEKKYVSDNIKKIAEDLGIKTEGKDENIILDEIQNSIKDKQLKDKIDKS